MKIKQFFIAITILSNCFFSTVTAQLTVTPPTGNTYATESGTIVTSPATGAVVGNLTGSFNVSPTGAATYSVPIEGLPGINGMQPNISLEYNSQSGNGIAGWGWNIGGLSMISRVPRNQHYDTERTGIDWTKDSPLALDGQRLIKVNTWGNDSIEYVTESGLDKVIGYNINCWGPLHFKVYTKDGKVLEYGDSTRDASYYLIRRSNTRGISDDSEVRNLGWALVRIIDNNNNFIDFSYRSDNTAPAGTYPHYVSNRIDYITYGNGLGRPTTETVARIQFEYKDHTSPYITYIDGLEMSNKYILDKILIQIPDGRTGTTLQTYHLDHRTGDNIYYLESIKRTNAEGEFIHPLKFEWFPNTYSYEYAKTVTFKLPTQTITNFDQVDDFIPYAYGDIDGDGLVDVVVRTSLKNGNHKWIVYRNNGDNSFEYKYEGNWDKNNENLFLFLDRDGDGRDELYIGTVTKGHSHSMQLNCYKMDNNNTFQADRGFDIKWETSKDVYDKRGSLYAIQGDFKGDRSPQFIVFSRDNTPEFSFGVDALPFQGGAARSRVFLTDINGNGKQEIARVTGSTTHFYEHSGGSFKSVLSSNLFQDTYYFHTGDFNGDGNTDMLVKNRNSPYEWKIWTSTGKGFIETNMASSMPGSAIPNHKVSVIDVNKDGKSDIFIEQFNIVNGSINNVTLKILLSTGNSFVQKTLNSTAEFSIGGFIASNFKSTHSQDILVNYNVMRNSPQILSLSRGVWFNKIKAITDSYNNRLNIVYENENPYRIRYQQITEGENGEINPKNFLPVLEVVKKVTGNNMDLTYAYTNPKVHKEYRGFLGFETITTDNYYHSSIQTQEYSHDPTLAILYPVKNTVKIFGTTISETTNDYSIERNIGSNKHRYFLKLNSQTSKDFLRGTTVTESFSNYDTERNPQTIKTDYGGGITSTKTLTYIKQGSRFNNKIASQKIVQAATGQTSITRDETFAYDAKGNLTTHTVDPNHANKVVTSYSDYDKYGNAQKITTTANGISRSETLTYTANGRLLKTKKNDQLNQTITYNYDDVKCLLISKVDRIGTTSYQYDKWGRLTKTIYPDGVQTAHALQWAGTISGRPTNAKYYSWEQTSGESPVWVWYDYLGREIRRDSYGLNNKKILVETTYNSKNQVLSVSDPYFEGATAKPVAVSYVYDDYGRKQTETTPLGTTTYTYTGLTNKVVSPAHTVETTTNAAGWVTLQKTDGKTVDFVHYANGQVRTATPQGGNPVTMEYDLQGNRTKLIDPSAGTITSEYNGWGELKWSKQAVHNTSLITTTYDYLSSGLLNFKQVGTLKTSYAYDTKHRLSSISIPGQSQTFVYDNYDRIIQTTDNFDNKTYIHKTEYDAFGRVYKETYPSGYFTINIYDNYGYLIEVTDDKYNLIWMARESNARGQLTKTQIGNDEKIYGFDTKGFPTSVSCAGIMNLTYTFNNKGNLTHKRDVLINNEERFHYDSLDRLYVSEVYKSHPTWGWSVDSYNTVDYHSTSGNITHKGGFASDMRYGENGQPHHALTSASYNAGLHANISQPQTIEYTDFKKASRIVEGDNTLQITYGVDEQRVKSLWVKPTGNSARWYSGNYEEEFRSGSSNFRRIHYICGGNGLAAIYVQNTLSTISDTLYYAHTDYQGSLIALSLPNGTVVERYAYDAWGKRKNPANWSQNDTRQSLRFSRGYTMHEHLPEFNLINMNGRMYDPLAGMFLSPDPYIQAPGNWLNYNRYSYCLNNPTKYTDPTGELAWFYWLGAALAGGITNLVSNWKNVEGVWDFISTFGIGAGAAVGVLATGGSGAGVMIGTAAVGGAAVGANNSVVAQTGKNFEGFSNVDWSQVGVQAAVGGVAGAAGAAAGYGVLKTDFLVNGVSSPILRSAVVSPIAAGAGHVVGGTTANLFAGQNLGDAFFNSFDGIGTSMAIGGAIGVTATTAMSLASGVNPINGNKLNTSNHAQQRILERNVSRSDINDALKNPLKVTEVQHRENGPSVKYIGNKVTVVVNPETGNIITVIPTGTKVALKLGGTR